MVLLHNGYVDVNKDVNSDVKNVDVNGKVNPILTDETSESDGDTYHSTGEELCLEEGQEITTRIKNLNTFKNYLKYWRAPLNAIDNILELTVEIMELAENNMLYPDNPNTKTEKVVRLSKKMIDLDVTPFYGELIGFHLKGDCSRMARLMNNALVYYSNFFGGDLSIKIIMD